MRALSNELLCPLSTTRATDSRLSLLEIKPARILMTGLTWVGSTPTVSV